MALRELQDDGTRIVDDPHTSNRDSEARRSRALTSLHSPRCDAAQRLVQLAHHAPINQDGRTRFWASRFAARP